MSGPVRLSSQAKGDPEPLADLARTAPVALARVHANGTILWANETQLALLGTTPDRHFGARIQDLAVDAASAAALLESVTTGKGTRDHPLRLRADGGAVVQALVDVKPVQGADGSEGIWALRDITDRARVAQERADLLEKAVREQGTVTTTTDGYLHFAPDWTITFARLNAGPERSAAIVGKTLWEIYPDVRGTEFEDHYRGAMADRKPRTFRAYYAPQDLWLENRLYPAGDGLALFYRDIGWHVDLERQLRERSRQQEAVARLGHAALLGQIDGLMEEAVRSVGDVLALDLVGVLEVVPDGLRVGATHGYPSAFRGQVIGPGMVPQSAYTLRTGQTAVVPDLAKETRFTPSAVLRDMGAISGISVVLLGPDGPHGVLSGHARAVRAFSPDDVHFVESVAHLVSSALRRVRTEEQLRQHRDNLEGLVAERTAELQEAYREMEAFNYTVSHDLRGPLRAIGGFVGLLERRHGKDLPEEARAILGHVSAGVGQMSLLIQALLDLGRLQRLQPTRVEVDVSALARQVGEDLKRSTGRDVPLAVQPGLVAHADPALLRIVLANLLGNAWKFTRDTPRPRIEFLAVPDAHGPRFVVRDNGAGFPQDQAGELFAPFRRLHTASEFEGNGIGLATVRRIVERHGGQVTARGAPGQGAEIGFSLPDKRAPAATAAAER